MRGYLKMVFAVVFAFTAITVTANTAKASDINKGQEFIDLNAQEHHKDVIHHKDKKWVPHFPHKLHQEKYMHGNESHSKFKYTEDWVCSGCHHTSEKDHQPTACLKCKDVKKMLTKNKAKEDGKKFENIFHNNCRDGCHKALAKSDKAKYGNLKKCKFCHKSKPGKDWKSKYPAPRHGKL